MPIIYTSRNLPGGIGGDYTNGAWGSLMNTYSVRFTGPNSGPGSSYNGSTFNFSGSVYFPYSGVYTIRAAADNSGSLNVGGVGCNVSGFGGQGTTSFYSTPGTKSISGSVYNAPSSDDFNTNPYGIAFTIDAPSRPPAPSVTLTRSPAAIIQGQCATLSWSSSGVGIYYRNMSNISSSSSGSTTVCPQFTTMYFFDVRGEGGQTVRYATVTVYIPPTLVLTANRTVLIAGECATLSWSVSGDGDTVIWTSGNINNGNVTSAETVCPAVTTTYSAYATGLGGTSPTASVTIYVYQVPVINEFNVPEFLNYGENGNIDYDVSYANQTVQIQKTYNYNTYTSDQGITQYPVCGTAELDGPNPTIDNLIGTGITYDNFGPRSVTYTLTIAGNGGGQSISKTVPIIIDEEIDNLNVDESDGKFANEEPVYTRDVLPEDTTVSDLYMIDDIDIPVEVKSDYPISISKNSGEFEDVRQIGSAPPSGSAEPVIPDVRSLQTATSIDAQSIVDEEEFNLATQASSSLSFSDGTTSKTIILGQSVTISWYVQGYTSASISPAPGALSITSGSVKTYSVQNIPRWFSTSPAPGDHMCSPYNPGGYSQEGTLFKSFTTQAPGTFLGYDAESPGVKPSAIIGYVYPFYSSGHPVGVSTIYEKIDPNGGPPNGFGTIWTTSSGGEGPYTSNGPNRGFKAPTSGYSDASSVTFSGSSTQTPAGTTTYTLSTGGSCTVTVLIPPSLILSVSGVGAGNTVIAGQQFTITWYTTGTTTGVVWTAGPITNGNVSSSQTFTAADSLTFSGYATDAGAGASPVSTITVRVVQIPTFEWSVPENLRYNDQCFVGFESEYCNTSITITPTFVYADGTVTTGPAQTYGPAGSAEIGGANTEVNVPSTEIPIPYNLEGPEQIQLTAVAVGEGGSQSFNATIPVIIDRTPDGLIIEEIDDAFRDEEPVFTPDVTPEDIIESQLYEINGIDLPVKVKSNYPIQIQINQDGDWDNVEQI